MRQHFAVTTGMLCTCNTEVPVICDCVPLKPEANHADSLPHTPVRDGAAGTQLLTFYVEGMSCGGCATLITDELRSNVAGVEEAHADFEARRAEVVVALGDVQTVVRVVESLHRLGYRVSSEPLSSTAPANENAGGGEAPALERPLERPSTLLETAETQLLIEGMSCGSCAVRIERALQGIAGVSDASVNFATLTGKVTHAPATTVETVVRCVTEAGYKASVLRSTSPSYATRKRDTTRNTDAATTAVDVVEANDATAAALERTQEIRDHLHSFKYSALLSVPLVIAMCLMVFTDIMDHYGWALLIDLIQFAATTPIVFIFGRHFFIRAWRDLHHSWAFTMDTLVATGVGCTYVYSSGALLASLLTGHHAMTYFDTVGMLTAFMLLGRYLEARAKRSTSNALVFLMRLVPATCVVVREDDSEEHVPPSTVSVGARVRVLAGERVPVDGTVLTGVSEVNQQMVTGESVPRTVRAGDALVGGTLNLSASLLMTAEKVGGDTVLAQILRIVQEAQTMKPAVQRIADRIAMYFVPAVLGVSVLTLTVWLALGWTGSYPASWRPEHTSPLAFALNFFIATVVAACPCALGLATPTAIMTGTGVGAQNGVLVKSGAVLEAVGGTTCVVFDKTGTITKGQLEVRWWRCLMERQLPLGMGGETGLARRLVAAAEAQSTHPIARAVHTALSSGAVSGADSLTVESAVNHVGMGVEATFGVCGATPSAERKRHQVLVGNLSLMRYFNAAVSTAVADAVAQKSASGYTTVVGAIDGVACVVVALADEPRPEAAGVVAKLRAQGMCVMMVTGDNAGVAARVAQEVGIDADCVRAEVMPTAKADIVRELQTSGKERVLFVGDGINDSPALALADVGVALGAGTEVAMEAAAAVLMRNSLVDLLNLQALSRITVRRIYSNFIWAFAYNAAMLPLACGILYPVLHYQISPVLAGVAMVLSSLSVLASSLSIRCFRLYNDCDFYHGV